MADFDPKMIDALRIAVASVSFSECEFEQCEDLNGCICAEQVKSSLRALPISPDALNALWRGEATVVPNEPTEAMQEAAHYVRSFHLFGNPTRGTDEVLSAGNAASPYARKDEP